MNNRPNVETDNGHPPHRITGHGETLIFLHNGFYSQKSWDSARADLEKIFTCVSFDRSGYGMAAGDSDADGGIESGVVELEAFVQFLEKNKGLRPPFNFAGHCIGGAIALHYAAIHPENVKRLILEGTGFRSSPDITRRVDLSSPPWSFLPLKSRDLLIAMHGIRYAEKIWTRIIAYHGSYILKDDYDSLPLVRSIACPVLLINGAKDFLISPDHARMAAAQFHDVRVWIATGAGHDVHREIPREWGRKVGEFLNPSSSVIAVTEQFTGIE